MENTICSYKLEVGYLKTKAPFNLLTTMWYRVFSVIDVVELKKPGFVWKAVFLCLLELINTVFRNRNVPLQVTNNMF